MAGPQHRMDKFYFFTNNEVWYFLHDTTEWLFPFHIESNTNHFFLDLVKNYEI